MSIQAQARPRPTETSGTPPTGDQRVVWPAIGWEGYEALLRLQGERSRPQLLYLDGDVTLMAPSHVHELWVDRLGWFVRELLIELDIPSLPTREVTFRRNPDEAGVQPDDSFYLANHGAIVAKKGRENIDLRVDPPPDLVIEFVHTNDADDAVEVLRRLGVPEVWVGDVDRLRFLVRGQDGRYREADRSLAFPFLQPTEVFLWATRTDLDSFPAWARALRRWIAEVVAPRIQPEEGS